MARSPLLPLPDSQASAVLRAVSDIEATLPHGVTTHVLFVDRFIAAVHAATGRIYGASTYRRLLKQFAPHRGPGTVTLQRAVERFRAEHQAQSVAPTAEAPAPAVQSGKRAQSSTDRRDDAWEKQAEILQYQQLELDQARARAESAERRAAAADAARERALLEAAAATAELEAAQQLATTLQASNEKLTAALQLAAERAASENKANMNRIDTVRQETRAAEARMRDAEVALGKAEKALRDERILTDNFRMQVAHLQQQLSRSRTR